MQIGSMNSRGNPYHNAQAESFMKTQKVEEVFLRGYESCSDVITRLPVFIDQIYNAKRLHSAPGNVSPNQFEQSIARPAA
jgi:putative transposase